MVYLIIFWPLRFILKKTQVVAIFVVIIFLAIILIRNFMGVFWWIISFHQFFSKTFFATVVWSGLAVGFTVLAYLYLFQ
jgi:hypothetical protein